MALYQDGILISGANQLPQMTMAEYLAIPVGDRPTYWVCTDRNYSDLSADNVTYDDTQTEYGATKVQGVLEAIKTLITNLTNAITGKVSKSGDTMTGDLTLSKASTVFKIRAAGSRYHNITSAASSSDKDIVLPNKSGTLALLSDMSIVSSASGTGYEVRFVSIGGLKFIYLSLNGLTCTSIGQNVLTVDCPSGFSFSATKRGVAVGDYSNQSGRIATDIDINCSLSKINFACYPVINNQYVGNLGTSIFLYGNVFVMI